MSAVTPRGPSCDGRHVVADQREGGTVRTWPGGITAITLFVDDLAATRRFYLDVFELPVVFEDEVSAVFRFGATLVNLLQATEAPALIGPAQVADPGSGARSQLTLEVDDVDATCSRLVAKGVAFVNGPMDRPWGIRTAAFADPGGHIWEIAQALVTAG